MQASIEIVRQHRDSGIYTLLFVFVRSLGGVTDVPWDWLIQSQHKGQST